MKNALTSQSGIFRIRIGLIIILCSLGASFGWLGFAGTPSSGTLTPGTPTLTYDAGPFNVPNQSPLGLGQLDTGPRCDAADPCDSYTLTATLPAGYAAAHPNGAIKITMYWTDTASGQSNYDLYIYNGINPTVDGNHPADHQSASGMNPEVAVINPLIDGTTQYTLEIVPNTPTQENVHVRIELLAGSSDVIPNFGGADPTAPGVPRYQIFIPPSGSTAEPNNGEFNIGFNPHSKRIMVMNSGPIWRLTPPEILTPAKPECCEALWEDRSAVTTNTPADLDPILWTDQTSGRTFASNSTAGANSSYAYTDSDGEPSMTQPTGWTEGGFSPPDGGADHETIGSGPYPPVSNPVPGGTPIPNPLATVANQGEAVYYCSQDVVGPASCQRSDTLGVSYGPGVLAYEGNGVTSCGGLHGHLHVAPDGTVWLPVNQCAGAQGGSLSTTAGASWQVFTVPGSHSQEQGADPSIAIDSDSTIYYAYVNNEPVAAGNPPEGHAHVQVGHRNSDNTITWTHDVDLGTSHGIKNAAEIEAVGGSSGRAAVGFLGTDVNGDYQANSFPGKWYAFIATTYDGGQTWTTVNATPNDPVQNMTGIWQQGGSAADRNLLDFNEITIDDKGRVLYGFSDGCVTADCIGGGAPNDFVAHMRVARQSGGKTLLASYDANTDTTVAQLPKPPCLSGTRDPLASHLAWKVPDNRGSDIVTYQIFRGTTSGGEQLIGQTVGPRVNINDTTTDPSVAHYFYYVKAVNGVGTGPQSNEIDLVVAPIPTPCTLPGILAVNDLNPDGTDNDSGQNTPPDPSVNVKQVFIAEPFLGAGVNEMVFTMQVGPSTLGSAPPSSQWYIIWNRQQIAADGSDRFYVAMISDATGAVSFEYGNFGPPLPLDGSVPASNANTPTKLGDLDSSKCSYNAATGVIAIYFPDNLDENIGRGSTLHALNVRTYLARPNAGQKSQNNASDITGDNIYTLAGNCVPPVVPFVGAASRMTHGNNAGTFDIALPQTGNVGIECRSGGANGNFTMVFTFGNPVTSVANASVTGTGSVSNAAIGSDPHEYIVNLTGVTNAQRLTVTLSGVSDTVGDVTDSLGATVGVLLGDVNASGRVDAADVSSVRQQTLQTITSSNFQNDINASGRIDAADVSVARQQTLTSLP